MYKAVGEAAYNDGLFSQAAPYQAYQASVSQFGDGGLGASKQSGSRFLTQMRRGHYMGASRRITPLTRGGVSGLGATSSLVPTMVRSHKQTPVGRRTTPLPPGRYQSVSGAGTSYADGTLGRTFLPAFSDRAMQGLGYTFRDGVLGDATSIVPSSVLPVTQDNLSAATCATDTKIAQLTMGVAIGGAVLALAVGYLYMKR